MSDVVTKFQWSKTSKGEEMFVIRTDEQDEFDLLVAKYREKVQTPVTSQSFSKSNGTGEVKMCPVHQVAMETRVSKKTGKPYKAHGFGPDICFGKEKDLSTF